jgi:hypothetical protein
MTALEVCERFIAARLATLSGVSAYSGAIPEGVSYPAIRFSFVESTVCSPQGEIQLTRCRYRIEAVASGLAYPHGLADSVESSVHGSMLLLDDSAVHAELVEPTSEATVLGGSPMRSCGGLYDLWVAWGR